MREMKDSGVKWVGEIPSSWKVYKVKQIADSNNDVLPENYEEEQEIDYIEIGSVTYEHGVRTTEKMKFGNAPSRARRIVHNGDTIISTVRTYLKAIAYIDNSLADKIVSTGFSVVTPHKDVVAKFLYYALSTHSFISNVEAHSVGISYPAINNTNLMDLKIVLPMQREQIQIASYLDAKCSKIDEIIEKQRAIIEKLKEYKFSIITEAVTKGINTDVELKDSTIDMCEQIPVHWSISQNRYLFSLRDEKNYKPLEEVRLLSLYTDLGVFPHGEQEERGNKAVKAEGYKVVYENDIVVNIILAWMGAIGRSAYDGVTSPAYDIYKPNENVCSRYYHYLYRTKPFSAECYKYGRGIMAMRWRTYSSEFKSIKVPVPPYIEQCQIADYLDSKCEMLDKTIADRNKAIEKLQEYKKSLIYEVVTGKKEV